MSRNPAALPSTAQRVLPAVVLAVALAALLAATPAVTAQQGDDLEVFVDTVDVEVVDVQVVVTDRRGRPVYGLTKDDFLVLEDGEPVELTNFYAVREAHRVVADGEADGADPAGGPELAPLPEDQQLHLAMVVDNANIEPNHRARAVDQIQKHIAGAVRPGDQVMVAALQPRPAVVQTFTDDMGLVLVALEELRRNTRGRSSLDLQRRRIENLVAAYDPAMSGPDIDTGGAGESVVQPIDLARETLSLIQAYGSQADGHTRRTFRAIGELVDILAGLPGRKAVVYVSDGLSPRPGLQLMENWFSAFRNEAGQLGVGSPQSEARQWDATDAMQSLVRKAAAAGVTFYPLDAQGARTAGGDVGVSAIGASGSRTPDLSTQEPLLQLASATGGWSMLNAANVDSLFERIGSDYANYYSLGYRSPKSGEPGYHRIEVRLPGRDNLRVRHTEGYRADTPESRMAARTVSTLALDRDVADLGNPLGIRVQVGDGEKHRRRWRLPLEIQIPLEQVTLIPQGATHQGKLTIFVTVHGEDGGMADPQTFELPLRIPASDLPTARHQHVSYALELEMRKGSSQIAVGVRDELGGEESHVDVEVWVGES